MNLEAWLALLEERHPVDIELGLGRCGTVYERMGSPRPARKVFTIAGTNGKGSTVAYLAAMCGALGQRYGTYTSPHIFRFNERITVMDEPASDECLIQAFEQVESARGDVSLTYFEFTTLAGMLILQQADLDCAILEVGLGGRLDTVNLVDTDCAVITPIGLDHQEFLGPDLASIAVEKAGVLRGKKPVVCSQRNPPAPILQISADLRAPMYRRGIDFDLTGNAGAESGSMHFTMGGNEMAVSGPAMGGSHQLDNFAAALAAMALLNPDCYEKCSDISEAIANCRVPGRLQRVHRSPEILLDVGHNELAAEAVATYLKDSGRDDITCVLAMLADKSAEAVARALGHVCGRWFCADSQGKRGQSGKSLADRIEKALPTAHTSVFRLLDEAMVEAMSAANEDGTILVFGSFTTVSDAGNWLERNTKSDDRAAQGA
jgi:dihydrofolate synthase/folylpolyglutamate synthase